MVRSTKSLFKVRILTNYRDMKEQAYEAYWWLAENHEWATRHLDIEIVKVNPDTPRVDDDKTKNTKVEYWIESGYFDKDFNSFCHDTNLDCGGDSFDEALIAFRNLVEKHYPKPTDLFGKPKEDTN